MKKKDKLLIYLKLKNLSHVFWIISFIITFILFKKANELAIISLFCGFGFFLAAQLAKVLAEKEGKKTQTRNNMLFNEFVEKYKALKQKLYHSFLDSLVKDECTKSDRLKLLQEYEDNLSKLDQKQDKEFEMLKYNNMYFIYSESEYEYFPLGDDDLSLLKEDIDHINNIDMIRNIGFVDYFNEIFDKLLKHDIYEFDIKDDFNFQVIKRLSKKEEEIEINNILVSLFEFLIKNMHLKVLFYKTNKDLDNYIEISFEDELVYRATYYDEYPELRDYEGIYMDSPSFIEIKNITFFSKGIWLKYFYIFYLFLKDET